MPWLTYRAIEVTFLDQHLLDCSESLTRGRTIEAMSDTDPIRDSENDSRSTLGRARLTFATESDITEFVEILERYEAGELTPDQWRAFRLVRGVYGQRQDDVQMFRVKIPKAYSRPTRCGGSPTHAKIGRAASLISQRARTSSCTS